jgi:hypothetical protein
MPVAVAVALAPVLVRDLVVTAVVATGLPVRPESLKMALMVLAEVEVALGLAPSEVMVVTVSLLSAT